RRRYGDVLVPDMDGMHARQFGKGGGPVHVAVAHQDELRVDSLRKERFCEGFIQFGHGRYHLDCEVVWYATSMPGEAQSIQLKRQEEGVGKVSVRDPKRFRWVWGRRNTADAIADAVKGCQQTGVTCRAYAVLTLWRR